MDQRINQSITPSITLSINQRIGQRREQIEQTKQAFTCSWCHGIGYVRVDVPFGHPLFGKAILCQCHVEQLKRKQQQHLIESSGLLAFANFRQATFETYDPFIPGVREAYLQAFKFAQAPTGWLLLTGEYGCGKTHLAIAIAKRQIEAGQLVAFQVVPRLLDYLRAAFSPHAEQDYDERFQQLCEAQVLILDDFGTHNNTPWASDKLFQLLNYRYNAQAPTVITMNTSSWEKIEPRLYSRFQDKRLVQHVHMEEAGDYRLREEQE
jgi:DNA replication protein